MEIKEYKLEANGETAIVRENAYIKTIESKNFNNVFYKFNGRNFTWGITKDEDPKYCPFGPLIADIEISTICHGPKNKDGKDEPCKFCYKSNNPCGKNTTLEEFKVLFRKLPRTLTQIAFGIGDLTDLDGEMWKIFEYCRNNDYQEIIPNVTINGNYLTLEKAHKLKELCGAVAVSHYNDSCFDAVKMLTDIGMRQINIHQLLSEETFQDCLDLVKSVKTDERLKRLNAIVFLMLKPKGKRNDFHLVSMEKYKQLIDTCLAEGINFGMDSCSACVFDKVTEGRFKDYIEPCESFGLFSSYFNVDGTYFPCSFCEGEGEWKEGLTIKDDFLKDVWYNEKVNKYRELSLKSCRNCIMYNLELK